MITDEFYSEEQVAEFLSVKPKTLKNMSARRLGPPKIKVGHKIMYRRASLVAWLESRETQPAVASRKRRAA